MKPLLVSRFYDDTKDTDKLQKWTTPVIFEMYKIFEDLDIEKVLEPKVDERKTKICELHVAQLKSECKERNLSLTGKKVVVTDLNVFENFIELILGEHQ